MTDGNLSLRERKKRKTRENLVRISQRMFREKGYEETTLEEICEEAEISVPTLLAYFSTKARLALAPEWDGYDALKERLEDPDRAEPVIDVWREAVIEGARWQAGRPREVVRRHAATIGSDAAIRESLLLLQSYQELLAEALAQEMPPDSVPELEIMLFSILVVYGDNFALRQWVAGGAKGDYVSTATAVFDAALQKFPEVARAHRRK